MGTFDYIVQELGTAVAPLREAVSSPASFQRFLYRLGWKVADLPKAWSDLVAEVEVIIAEAEALKDQPGLGKAKKLLEKIKKLHGSIKGISKPPAGPSNATQFLLETGERIFEILLIDYLASEQPFMYQFCRAAGIIVPEFNGSEGERHAFIRQEVMWSRIPEVIENPNRIPEYVYGWGTDDLDFDLIAEHLLELLHLLLIPVYLEKLSLDLGLKFLEQKEQDAPRTQLAVVAPLVILNVGDEDVIIGLSVMDAPAVGDKKPGIIIRPYLPTEITISPLRIREDINLSIQAGSNVPILFGFVIRPGLLEVAYPNKDGALPQTGFGIGVEYTPSKPSIILGDENESRLEMKGASISFGLKMAGDLELLFKADVKDLTLHLVPSEGDSFINKLLNGKAQKLPIPFGFEWSNKTGLTFTGAKGLVKTFHPNLSLGPIAVSRLTFGLMGASEPEPSARFVAIANLNGHLGPIGLQVDKLGFQIAATFKPGNAGPFGLQAGFKSPDGLGLFIDSKVVKGGGYLYCDAEKGEYIGVAMLNVKNKVNVKALGIIHTKLPDGKPGYSFLLMITAEFQPIQLGLGFMLAGVGGLVGINRGLNQEKLFESIRNKTADEILFPEKLEKDVAKVVDKVNTLFPIVENRYTFALMGLFYWGAADLVTIKLGLILEAPSFNVSILGLVKAEKSEAVEGGKPNETRSLIRIMVNFSGYFDFDKKFIRFDAGLFDSHVMGLKLEGDMALRIRYDNNPEFLLTVGGFHPNFQPPELGLPKDLRRLHMTLRSGNPNITLDCYLALTSNTFQFGAAGHLRFEKWGVGVRGELSFDALFQFSPFRFEIGLYFLLAASWKGYDFASIEVNGLLSGPAPWKIYGKLSLSVWIFSITVELDETWGDQAQSQLESVEVLPLIAAELASPNAWEASPGRAQNWISTRKRQLTGEERPLVFHPHELLSVNQSVVPLGLKLDKFGERKPKDAAQFSLSLQGKNGTQLAAKKRSSHFAPTQFFIQSDEEKLKSPSYELYESGAAFEGLDALQINAWTAQDIIYEVKTIDDPSLSPVPKGPKVKETATDFNQALRNNALANAKGSPKVRPATSIRMPGERFVVVDQRDMKVQPNMKADNENAAEQLLKELLRKNPYDRTYLTILSEAELEA
jgi:hypothetical protein